MTEEKTTAMPLFPAALKLEPGGIYALEVDARLSPPQFDYIREALAQIGDPIGVKFVVLDKSVKVARTELSRVADALERIALILAAFLPEEPQEQAPLMVQTQDGTFPL